MARPTNKSKELTNEFAVTTPALTGVRQAQNPAQLGQKSISQIAFIINELNSLRISTNLQAFCALADEIEERDPVYRSALQTRKLAVAGLPAKLKPAGDDKASAELVADIQANILDAEWFTSTVLNLLDAISKGFAISEVMWKQVGTKYAIANVVAKPQHWYVFGDDRKTVRMRTSATESVELPTQKFLIHFSAGKAGLPVHSGLVKPVAFLYAISAIVQQNWTIFAELYGQPLRLGKYLPDARKDDIDALREAVYGLGTDAAAVLPESTAIEFVQSQAGSGDVYPAFLEYMDRQKRLLVLGGSLTGGEGSGKGSYALGKVHDEVRMDILRADATELSRTINQLINWYVEINYGPNVVAPKFAFQVEEPEDLLGLATIVEKLVPAGLEIAQEEVRSRFGFRTPLKGESIMGAKQASPATPSSIPNSMELVANASSKPDAIDELVAQGVTSWKKVEKQVAGKVEALVANSLSGEELAKQILALPKDEITNLIALLTAGAGIAGAHNALD